VVCVEDGCPRVHHGRLDYTDRLHRIGGRPDRPAPHWWSTGRPPLRVSDTRAPSARSFACRWRQGHGQRQQQQQQQHEQWRWHAATKRKHDASRVQRGSDGVHDSWGEGGEGRRRHFPTPTCWTRLAVAAAVARGGAWRAQRALRGTRGVGEGARGTRHAHVGGTVRRVEADSGGVHRVCTQAHTSINRP
jgi:hypothetical protein